ncbi:MAG: M24 family metallopeptidase [Planctomycetota bacterium]|jgi:antitoxin VapB
MTEELDGVDITATQVFPWHEAAKRDAIVGGLCSGKKFAADDGSPGTTPLPAEFAALRFALTEGECARYRVLGKEAALAMENAARAVEKGMTEADIAALVADECLRRGILPVVLLVAADGRIRSWRHPVVKTTPAEQCAMMVICGRRYGLIANVTRIVHFGELPADLAARHRAVCAVDAAMILATTPGKAAADIFAVARSAYAENGYPDEWQFHHQGGATGFQPREYIATPDCEETVRANQAFAWNPSICGTKSEDTVLVSQDGFEVLTAPSAEWPVLKVEAAGQSIARPDILVK